MSDERRNTSGLRLFRVDARFEFMIAAEDEVEAWRIAEESVEEALLAQGGWNAVDWVSAVTEPTRLDAAWRDAIPFGDADANPDDLTCAEILADPPVPTDAELEAAGQGRLL